MSLLATPETVRLWLANGTPTRLDWNGVRYTVHDNPTPLEEKYYGFTHIPAHAQEGWRFSARTAAGYSLLFEVARRAGEWKLTAVSE